MTSRSPTVTLGLPAYNEEGGLEFAVTALLNQSYSDFELVLADNASTDGTLKLMRRLQQDDSRIRILTSDRNLGAIGNFRRLLQSARGEYFAWVGAHDAYDPDWLLNLVQALSADPRLVLACARTYRHMSDYSVISSSVLKFDSREFDLRTRVRKASALHGAGERIYGLYRTAGARAYPIRATLRWDTLFLAGISLVGDMAAVESAVWYRSYHDRPVNSPWNTASTLRRQLRMVFPADVKPSLLDQIPAVYHQIAMLRDGMATCRRMGRGFWQSLDLVRLAMAGVMTRSSLLFELQVWMGLFRRNPRPAQVIDEDREYAL